MSDRNLRPNVRLDYRKFNSTGEKVTLDSSSESAPSEEESDYITPTQCDELDPDINQISDNLSQFTISGIMAEEVNKKDISSVTLTSTENDRLLSLFDSLHDDISDFIDENSAEELLVIEDVVACVSFVNLFI